MENYELIQVKKDKVTLNLNRLDDNQQPCFDCLILLNSSCEPWIYQIIVPKARTIIASDGGANFIYDSPFRNTNRLVAIIGDLDSLNAEAKQYYESQQNVAIIKDDNQDSNDFEKAITYAKNQNFNTIVSLGVLGGRIDQELCNLSAIQKYSKLYGQRFIAIGNTSLMFLIKEKETAIIHPGKLCLLNEAGLFCFGKSKVSTKGFKWELSKQGSDLQWGKLISSSNVIVGSQLQINTEQQIFFTISLGHKQKPHI